MQKNTVSIVLDRESLTRLVHLLGNRPVATGVHCGDDDGEGVKCGTIALGVHCGDDGDE
jgi:hypothetical protein